MTKSTKFVSESEYNSRRTAYNRSYNNQIVKSKKNVCCQTDRSYPIKSEKHVKHIQTENYTSTNTSSSKDIKTIFATDRANFDSERSKTNLELLGTRYMKKIASRKHRNDTTEKRPRKYDTKNSSRICGKENKFVKLKRRGTIKNINLLPETFFDNSCVTNFASDNLTKILRKYNRRKEALSENKKYDLQRMLNNRIENDVDISKSIACNDTYFIDSTNRVEDEEGITLENSVPVESNVNSPETSNVSWKSNNYLVEDKTSEVMILGNVKKRLEEDYDDYFSLHDDDLFHDAEDSNDILEIDQPSAEVTMNHYDYYRYTLHNIYPNEPKSMLVTASATKHLKTKQELTGQSVQTSRNCTSFIHKFRFANSSLNCNRSSLREQECSPSSSIEYCSARDVSLSKLQSSHDNCFSNDVSFKDDNMLQDTREFFDRIPVDSYTVCCYQRNSTPNFSNSSKLITESLDFETLTDCSRDQFRITSNERPNEESEKKVREEWRGYVRKMDLLPTYDFDTDSSYSDESLNRRIDVVIKEFTENLILSERKAKTKLRKMKNSTRHRQTSKRRKNRQQVCLEIFNIGCGYLNWRMRLSVGLYNSLYNSLSDSSKAMRKLWVGLIWNRHDLYTYSIVKFDVKIIQIIEPQYFIYVKKCFDICKNIIYRIYIVYYIYFERNIHPWNKRIKFCKILWILNPYQNSSFFLIGMLDRI